MSDEAPDSDAGEEDEVEGTLVVPADPAGTQPKVDRDALLPARPQLGAGEGGDGPEQPSAPLPEPVAGGAVGKARPYREAPHAARFQFVLGALLAIGAVAIVSLVWSVSRTGGEEGPSWSPWKPEAQGVAGAQQISDHVAPQYKTSKGQQLVQVEAGDLGLPGVELDMVVRQRPEQGGRIIRLDGDALQFRFCGLGPQCSLPGAKSEGRGLLLRREAIEIAGYAFHYLRGLDHAVFFLPPTAIEFAPAGGRKREVMIDNQILLFRRGDLRPVLAAPLRTTLKAPPPSVRTMRKAPEVGMVAALADRARFFYSLSGRGDGTAFLVLDQPETQSELLAAAHEIGSSQVGITATSGTTSSGER